MKNAKASTLLILMCVFNLLLASMALANELVVTEDGNVGIGTATPHNTLHVHELTSSYTNIQFTNATTGQDTAADGFRVGLDSNEDGAVFVGDNNALRFGTNNSERMTITNTGKVGIGINQPSQIFHVHQQGWSGARMTTDGTGVTVYDGVNFGYDNTLGAIIWNRENSPIVLSTNNSEKMRITSDGNVGIGVASPVQRLEVDGNIVLPSITGNKQIYTWSSTDGNWRIGMSATPGFTRLMATGHVQYLSYSQSAGHGFAVGVNGGESSFEVTGSNHNAFFRGSVGIGTANPDPNYKLDVNGNIRAVGWASDSDLRWKENINPIEDSLARVSQLRGVTYEWIDKSRGEGQQLGVIAQEVEEIFPQVVHTDSQGYKSVEYSKLVAPLIEAVKALKAENDLLKDQNQALKSSIEDIYARIAQLELQ